MDDETARSLREIDELIGKFFAAVSFSAAERPQYDSIRELFVESGLLIKGTGSGAEITSVDEFIQPRLRSVEDGVLTEFRETELSAATTVFGHAAHRESLYEKSGVSDENPIEARGIIFTQFVWTGSRWSISSMAWDDEREGLGLDDVVRS